MIIQDRYQRHMNFMYTPEATQDKCRLHMKSMCTNQWQHKGYIKRKTGRASDTQNPCSDWGQRFITKNRHKSVIKIIRAQASGNREPLQTEACKQREKTGTIYKGRTCRDQQQHQTPATDLYTNLRQRKTSIIYKRRTDKKHRAARRVAVTHVCRYT